MLEKAKYAARWVYNWITVIAGTAVALFSYGMDAFNAIIGATDITPFLTPDRALQIVTTIAILKGLHAFYLSRKPQA